MRRAASIGAVLLGALAYAGCGSDHHETAATGGSARGAGGEAPGAGGRATCATSGGVKTPGYRYESSGLEGRLWTAQYDTNEGSTVTLASGQMCACGNAVQTLPPDGGYLFPGTGVAVGWNLNEPADGGPPGEADLSGKTWLHIAVTGATDLNLRVELQVQDVSLETPSYYCAPLTTPADQTIPLESLRTACWDTSGVAFDKAVMRPASFVLRIVTDINRSYPFDFCLTQLSID